MGGWQLFLVMTIGAILIQGYFTMMEMAIVSFNRVRLQYFVAKKNRKAIWLSKLLQRPTYLFGTTLIGVNFFLQLGSESARLFYVSLGLNPDYALASQILIVVLFAELIPMFAARGHSEHVTMLGITPIYLFSKVLFPFIWLLDLICKVVDWVFRSPPAVSNYLTRDELQRAIEGKDDHLFNPQADQLDKLVQNVFELRSKSPIELMTPIQEVRMVPYNSRAREIKELVEKAHVPYLPLYYRKEENIVGIIYTRDLLRMKDDAMIKDIARSPWFITERNSLLQIIKQFRWNNQHLAIVLNDSGGASGILTLDNVVHLLFDHQDVSDSPLRVVNVIVNRSFSAKTQVSDVNHLLGIALPTIKQGSLEDLMIETLGRNVQKKESVRVGNFRLTLEEVPLLADKRVRIESI